MNATRLLALADFVENHQPGLGFNMNFWIEEGGSDGGLFSADRSGHRCGTVACIAGHEALKTRMEETGFKRVFRVLKDAAWFRTIDEFSSAKKSLDLTEDQANDLFAPWVNIDRSGWDGHDASQITPTQAARVVRNFAITGKVNWAVAFAPADPEIEAELFRLAEANRLTKETTHERA